MSSQALTWAYAQKSIRSTAKFVLVVMSDYTNELGLFYGSHHRLEEATNLNRKTIMEALDYLQEHGCITDTQKRAGDTGRIKVYQLNMEGELKGSGPPEKNQDVPKTGLLEQQPNSPVNGTIEKNKWSRFYHVIVPFLPCNSPENGTQSKTKQQQDNNRDRYTRNASEQNNIAPPCDPTDATPCQVGDVTLILQEAGLPFSALSRHDHIEVMRDIAKMGVTRGELREAVERAHTAKRGQPFGVFYVRPIVSQIVARRNGYGKNVVNGNGGKSEDALSVWIAEGREQTTAKAR